MKILVTGNLGYIGPELAKIIKAYKSDWHLTGLDIGIFAGCLTSCGLIGDTFYDTQHYVDVRDITDEHLNGIDIVVSLAAVSNDPIGKEFEEATFSINYKANINLANLCEQNGVKKFILASSCSLYGSGGSKPRTEADQTMPLTAYANSKITCEDQLKALFSDKNMELIFLRFATACGISDRLRLDLVLNDFVASAVAFKKITILSDGSPWRPLIDVQDMCRAIVWAIEFDLRNNINSNTISINIGSNEWNYSVKELAELVCVQCPGTILEINNDAPEDKRSYKVDFTLYKSLAGSFYPSKEINTTIQELVAMTSCLHLQCYSDIRSTDYIRLNKVRKLIESSKLTKSLRRL